MKLKRTPELLAFLSTYIADADSSPEGDEQAAQAFVKASSAEKISQVAAQAKALLADELPVDEFGSEANRWFGDADEASSWLQGVLKILESAQGDGGNGTVTKDSNGAVLAEGDSVQVIKDLKVKGGSSDLKRGTMIKKIHLIGDPDNIECRVDGSTLVLKTMFLKKV